MLRKVHVLSTGNDILVRISEILCVYFIYFLYTALITVRPIFGNIFPNYLKNTF